MVKIREREDGGGKHHKKNVGCIPLNPPKADFGRIKMTENISNNRKA